MHVRSLLATASALLLIALVPAAPLAAQEQQGAWLLVASLTGAAEVPPPGDMGGSGVGAVVLTRDDMTGGYTACFTLAVVGLSAPAIATHIHPGRSDVAGPVVVPFEPPTPVASGCVSVEAGLGDQIVADPEAFYINVHTSEFPAGAIRGQLTPASMMMDMMM